MTPKILVLCSGRLAVPALQRLAQEGLLLGIVVPATDPNVTALLQQLAFSLQCPFHAVTRTDFPNKLKELCVFYKPAVAFVVGFPWRIPETVLPMLPKGFLNFHGGLLPELRGPDPIFEAIRQELTETALTIHRMDAGWDTGPIICEERFTLTKDLTHGLLSTRLAYQCAQSIPVLLEKLQQDTAKEQPRSNATRYYHRVTPAQLYINWKSQSASAIAALIRACNPIYGGAAACIKGWTFRIVDASVVPNLTHTSEPGTLLALDGTQGALIQCRDGAVLQVHIIGTDEGYFPAVRLYEFGFAPGIILGFPNI